MDVAFLVNSAFEEDSNSPEDKEVDDLDGAEEADAHAEAEEAPDVGQQLQPREPLLPLLLHEVQLLEVDVHVRHVVDDVRVVLVLGVLLCKDIKVHQMRCVSTFLALNSIDTSDLIIMVLSLCHVVPPQLAVMQ